MYVCICKAIKEDELRAVIQLTSGAEFSFEGVQKACGAGTDCGACRFKIERQLRESIARPKFDMVAGSEAGGVYIGIASGDA